MRMIIRRISFYLATAIVAISLDFFIPRVIPGNPVAAVLAKMQGAVITKATIRSLELQFGSGIEEITDSSGIFHAHFIQRAHTGEESSSARRATC